MKDAVHTFVCVFEASDNARVRLEDAFTQVGNVIDGIKVELRI